jgi:hypothetical protein
MTGYSAFLFVTALAVRWSHWMWNGSDELISRYDWSFISFKFLLHIFISCMLTVCLVLRLRVAFTCFEQIPVWQSLNQNPNRAQVYWSLISFSKIIIKHINFHGKPVNFYEEIVFNLKQVDL